MKYKSSEPQFKILLFLGLVFFCLYAFLSFNNPVPKFTWPDETANYFFINNFVQHNSFSYSEPLNSLAGNLLKPRSFNVYQNNLVPGSFLGFVLVLGLIAKIIGLGLIKFITPLLAVISALFFYKILGKIFSSRIAFISTILFFLNPAWWYYANFNFLPNVTFLALVIMAVYCYLLVDKNKQQNNYLYVFFGSCCLALALIIRTNEFVWLFLLLGIIALAYRKKIHWQYLVILGGVLVITFLPIFYFNQLTYGNWLSFGYLKLEQGTSLTAQLPTEFTATGQSQLLNLLQFVIVPFGVHPSAISDNFSAYTMGLFWWLFVPAILGMFYFLKKYELKAQAVFFMLTISVSSYLAIYYGSWVFADLLTSQLNLLGMSYVRYWLPIYILSLPYVAIFYDQLLAQFSSKKIKVVLSSVIIFSNLFLAINLLYLQGNDNLVKIKKTIQDYEQISQEVNDLTEANAVIISQRSDKIFFPERRVIGRWSPEDIRYWTVLRLDSIHLYYYAYEGDSYLADFTAQLEANQLALELVSQINEQESLYKIILLNNEN